MTSIIEVLHRWNNISIALGRTSMTWQLYLLSLLCKGHVKIRPKYMISPKQLTINKGQ